MIRIVFLIDRVFSRQAGTEQQLLGLIQGLDKNRFDVFLCCLRKTDFLDTIDFCNVRVFETDSLMSVQAIKSAFAFTQFLRLNKIDIVQTHFKDSNLFGVFCAKVASIQTVISSRRGEPYWSGFFGMLLTRCVNIFTDHFFVNSFSVEKFLVEKERVSPRRIDVFANGMDVDRIRKGLTFSRKDSRQRLGVSEDEFVVGIVAGLRSVKRHDVFIQAASLLCVALDGWRFVVVGSGRLQVQLQAMVQDLGMKDAFSFLGLRDDVPEIVRSFDVGVLCSDYESTSNTILEYVALEVPVVCTRVGDNPRYVDEGSNGFVVEPGDVQGLASAIRCIRGGAVAPQGLKAKSDLILKNFDSEVVVHGYEKKFLELSGDAY